MERCELASLSLIATGPSSNEDDPILDKLQSDMGVFLTFLTEALSYPVNLENTMVIHQIESLIPTLVSELNSLQFGTAREQEAFNSPECQNILKFLTQPVAPGYISLLDASSKFDNSDSAAAIYYLENNGLFNTKNGLLGMVRIFLAVFNS